MILNYKILNILFAFFTTIDFVISVIDFDTPFETDIKYETYYFRSSTRFDQRKLDPSDFFLSINNPHYIRIPKPDMSYSNYHHMTYYDLSPNEYSNIGNELFDTANLNITQNDLQKTVLGTESYSKTRPDFTDIQMKLLELDSQKIKFLAFQNESSELKSNYKQEILQKLKKHEANKADRVMPAETLLQINDENEKNEKTNEKLKPLNSKQFQIVKTFMTFLPKVNETAETFNQNHMELLKFILYINPTIREQLKPGNPITTDKISSKRVKHLKSSFLLKNEKYYYYIIRMKHYGFIPFHYEFCQTEFGAYRSTNVEENTTDDLEVLFNASTADSLKKRDSGGIQTLSESPSFQLI